MKNNLASKRDTELYGGLGFKVTVKEMLSQSRVMFDSIDPEEGIDDKDILRLYRIASELFSAVIAFEKVLILNEN